MRIEGCYVPHQGICIVPACDCPNSMCFESQKWVRFHKSNGRSEYPCKHVMRSQDKERNSGKE